MKWEILIQKLYGAKTTQMILDWLPASHSVVSFDCATKSMGVCQADIDFTFVQPSVKYVHRLESLAAKVAYLERLVELIGGNLDNMVRIQYINVWDLAPDTHFKDFNIEMNAAALAAKFRSTSLVKDPDTVLYEYQMNVNDKSRTISHFLIYHYTLLGSRIVKVGATHKNSAAMPVVGFDHPYWKRKTKLVGMLKNAKKLHHQYFLQCENDKYQANKKHCAANLLAWSHIFGVKIDHIPLDNLDDAADAFMQIMGSIRQRLI